MSGTSGAGQESRARRAVPTPLTLLDEVGSTNDAVLELGRGGAPHGTAVAARRQTAGRGRRGHAWESPEGNLYLSVLLRPDVSPSRMPGLAAACGLGVLDCVRGLGPSDEPLLKWPNDLLARGRKLAGILVEAARGDDCRAFAVCGVGLNVEHAPRGLGAVCLRELGCSSPVPELAESLRRGVTGRVDTWAALDAAEPLTGIRDDYLASLAWLGERVVVLSPSGERIAGGTLEDVDPWGRAVVSGVTYASELASLRPAPDGPASGGGSGAPARDARFHSHDPNGPASGSPIHEL